MITLERADGSRRVGLWSLVGLLLVPLVLAGGFLGRGAGVAFAAVFVIGDCAIDLPTQFAQLLQVHRFQVGFHGITLVGMSYLAQLNHSAEAKESGNDAARINAGFVSRESVAMSADACAGGGPFR